MLRLFVALPLPPALRARLATVQQDLGAAGLPFRWSRHQGLHLTLVFVGERPAADVPALAGALVRAVAGLRPIALTLAGLGAFPGLDRPRVLWAGLRGDPAALAALAALHRAVVRELDAAGVPFERRPFRAHVTLGRAAGALGVEPAAALQAAARGAAASSWGTWTAAEVYLMASELRPGGAVYTALARVPLAGPDGATAAGAPAARREEALR
jgi:2'-5' RNA ligase